MIPRWTADGPRYSLEWGGRPWSLDVEAGTPGLTGLDGSLGPLLSIEGINARGRGERGILGGYCLISHEVRSDRVEAIYAPAGWHSLRVRVAWRPRDGATVDLEVQIQAFTVDELQGVEIVVGGAAVSATPAYLQIVHPDDLSRTDDGGGASRLFGHDLEKGFVLRGRVRGVWLAASPGPDEVDRLVRAFLHEPLPLGT